MILEDDAAIDALLARTKRIAVLGIKPESRASEPAFYVPKYMQQAGFEIIPVPTYYPDIETILGQRVHRRVRDVPPPIDLVNVFRRSVDLAPHLEDLLAARPHAVWLQSGIRDDAFAARLAADGITVVQERCLMVEHRRRS
jgi:uncharacterized protein